MPVFVANVGDSILWLIILISWLIYAVYGSTDFCYKCERFCVRDFVMNYLVIFYWNFAKPKN